MSTVTQDKTYQKPLVFHRAVTTDRQDTMGYAEIYSAGTTSFGGAVAAGLAVHADYSVDIKVDGSWKQVTGLSFTASTTWAQVAAAIQAALRVITSNNETVAITNYKIRATSNYGGIGSENPGVDSKMQWREGTGGGTPLLAAIAAIPGGLYTATIATPVDGREGLVSIQVAPSAPTTKDFFFVGSCVDSSYKQKAGLLYSYSKITGCVTVADDADSAEVKDGDIITICGVFV